MRETMDCIVVVDYGGQYAHLIARRVRECRVYSEVVHGDEAYEEIKSLPPDVNVKGLILSGGPMSVLSEDSPKFDPRLMELGVPILGICFGHQLLAHALGGKVEALGRGEYGTTYVYVEDFDDILEGLDRVEKVWMSHSDTVTSLPSEFHVLARTDICPVAAFKHKERPIYGVQWHPEVVHTDKGMKIIENFVFKVCKCKPEWVMEDFIEKAIEEIIREVGNGKAIIALSGGIDSSTTAVLAARAIGDRLYAVFVDHGFMREGEPEQIREYFGKAIKNFIFVDARKRFLERLKGVTDPEQKRRIIGEEFVRVFEEVARGVGAEYLLQGTIYPDRIESGFRRFSDKIKTHHNVAGLPSKMEFKKVVEPLRDLYKDEVREIAKRLGLPDEIVHRQPFPGPGLAVRVIGEVTEEKLRIVRRADKIVREEIERAGLARGLWQYFAVLTDTKSTGVKGDARAYGYTVAVRIVESRDAMTANFAKIPYDVLERISTRITNEISEVTRVVYDITNKPPATIEWE
ncbi:MAG: glutamine-hydrolyzing GMP synthase [Candidatus Verstraetearchaeota archaeon]|nr:glutamine-hydrolyzing GMP synthase [Candidatus Verstraetearchaeota archaeon]